MGKKRLGPRVRVSKPRGKPCAHCGVIRERKGALCRHCVGREKARLKMGAEDRANLTIAEQLGPTKLVPALAEKLIDSWGRD